MSIIPSLIVVCAVFALSVFLLSRQTGVGVFKKNKQQQNEVKKITFWVVFPILSAFFIGLIVTTFFVSSRSKELKQFSVMKQQDFKKIEMVCYGKNYHYPFTCQHIVITNKGRLKQYHESLQKDRNYAGNHPTIFWKVRIFFSDETNNVHTFIVVKTNNSGMMISYYGINNTNCDGFDISYRNDKVERLIIEDFK